MAEVVHRNLELMLPDLEELERSGIFSPEEIKEIVRRRRSMEYKLQRRPVRKEDYLQAIKYEFNLDRLRKARKKRLGVTSSGKDAEFGIQNRIHSLFKRAVKKFKADVRLWLQYIEFCQQSHHHVSLGGVLGKALALHPHKPGLWVMAAKFQFEDQHDPSSARSTMQRGLRSNPSSTHLWLEYFRMELMHVDKMKKRQQMLGLEASKDEEFEKLGSEFFSYGIPSIVFHEAVKAIPDDLEFHVGFLDIYRLFEDTEQRQEEVYLSLKEGYSDRALCWETLAQRHWVDTKHDTLTDDELCAVEENTEKCYREGLEVVSEPSSLWRYYIQWCQKRVEDKHVTDATRLRAITRLLTGYREATERGQMSEAMIEEQVQVLSGLGLSNEARKALVTGTCTYPQSHSLWLLRLKCEVGDGGDGRGEGGEENVEGKEGSDPAQFLSKLEPLCSEAIDKVPKEHSLSLWQFWLEQLTHHHCPHAQVEAVFQNAIRSTTAAAKEMLSMQYIDRALIDGTKSARKVYRKLLNDAAPVPYSLYCKCLEVEKSAERPNMRRLRELYEKATTDYGTDHPDIWLDYIKSEACLPGGDVTKVGQLHWKTMKTLSGEHTADFVARYSVLQLAT